MAILWLRQTRKHMVVEVLVMSSSSAPRVDADGEVDGVAAATTANGIEGAAGS
jgi:hypothetical protein